MPWNDRFEAALNPMPMDSNIIVFVDRDWMTMVGKGQVLKVAMVRRHTHTSQLDVHICLKKHYNDGFLEIFKITKMDIQTLPR